jgi:hypothetical protein
VTRLLSLFFCSHSPESFTPKFDELFQLSEIIAVEFAYVNGEKEAENYWNAVSRGDDYPPTTAQSHVDKFTRSFLDRLFFTTKLVKFELSAVNKTEDDRLLSLYEKSRRLWRQKQIRKAVEGLREERRNFALQIQERDASYARQLKSLVIANVDKRILCVRGLLHQESLSRELQQIEVAFDSYRFKEPYVYSIAELVTIASLHGEVVKDDTLVRVHIEEDYADKEISTGNFNYETRLRIREKVLSMTQGNIDEYIGSMKVE